MKSGGRQPSGRSPRCALTTADQRIAPTGNASDGRPRFSSRRTRKPGTRRIPGRLHLLRDKILLIVPFRGRGFEQPHLASHTPEAGDPGAVATPRGPSAGFSCSCRAVVGVSSRSMVESAKLKKLAELSEKDLRETVLMPLLSRMGFQAVTLRHGSRERGKDIICFKPDQLGRREYLAVVAKATDLNGSVSSSDGLREVLHQINQCFDTHCEDLFGMHEIQIDRVWVVTSKKIVPGAEDSVFDSLKKNNLDKVTRFIPGQRLAELIDEYHPAYWDASLEPADILREQKGRLIHFCRQILVALGGREPDVENTLNQAVHGYSVPLVTFPATRELVRLSPYQVEIDTIPEQYSHDFYLNACGSFRETYFRTKQHMYHAMFDVDEVIDHYENVMKKTDPEEFLREFDKTLSKDHPFARSTSGDADAAWTGINSMEQGIRELRALLERLKGTGKLEWATALVDSVAKLEPQISGFLDHLEKESFSLFWQLDAEEGASPSIRFLYETPPPGPAEKQIVFKTEHSSLVEEWSKYHTKHKRRVIARDVMEAVQEKIREHLDKLVPPKPGADE